MAGPLLSHECDGTSPPVNEKDGLPEYYNVQIYGG